VSAATTRRQSAGCERQSQTDENPPAHARDCMGLLDPGGRALAWASVQE
jgi:hypothetical protein